MALAAACAPKVPTGVWQDPSDTIRLHRAVAERRSPREARGDRRAQGTEHVARSSESHPGRGGPAWVGELVRVMCVRTTEIASGPWAIAIDSRRTGAACPRTDMLGLTSSRAVCRGASDAPTTGMWRRVPRRRHSP